MFITQISKLYITLSVYIENIQVDNLKEKLINTDYVNSSGIQIFRFSQYLAWITIFSMNHNF